MSNLILGITPLLQEPGLPGALLEIPGQTEAETLGAGRTGPFGPNLSIGIHKRPGHPVVNAAFAQFRLDTQRAKTSVNAGMNVLLCEPRIAQGPLLHQLLYYGPNLLA